MDLSFDFFEVEQKYMEAQKGKVLISEPFLSDTYFKRSIVLLTDHSEEGSIGFVLNKPLVMKLNDTLQDFPDFDASVSLGGPVNTNTVHFIHTLGDIIPNSVHVLGNIYWGGDFEVMKKLIGLGTIHTDEIRFFLGYSGWHPNQLEEELSQNSWLVTSISAEAIMKIRSELVWKDLLNKIGSKYALWPTFPEDPQSN